MNPAPDQPLVSSVSTVVTSNPDPNPVVPISPANNPPSPPASSSPPPPPETYNPQPTTISSPPPARNAFSIANADGPPHKKFPFMMVTVLLVVIIAGFVGSYLFFSNSKPKTVNTPVQIMITPPVTLAPSLGTNPFATDAAGLSNPFASPTASLINPFGTYQNPFTTATSSSESSQSYQNPFAGAK